MRAIIKTKSGEGHLEFGEWPEPMPAPDEITVAWQLAVEAHLHGIHAPQRNARHLLSVKGLPVAPDTSTETST